MTQEEAAKLVIKVRDNIGRQEAIDLFEVFCKYFDFISYPNELEVFYKFSDLCGFAVCSPINKGSVA